MGREFLLNKMAQDDSRPNFIKIKDGIYRVDTDFYKKLYRVNNKEEKEQFVNTIYNSINRKLTPKEEDMLQKFIEY